MRGGRAAAALVGLALALLAAACGRNPVLGEWELDRDVTLRSAIALLAALAVGAHDFGGRLAAMLLFPR